MAIMLVLSCTGERNKRKGFVVGIRRQSWHEAASEFCPNEFRARRVSRIFGNGRTRSAKDMFWEGFSLERPVCRWIAVSLRTACNEARAEADSARAAPGPIAR